MPRITIVYKIFNFKCMFLTLSLFLHLLPRKYNVTQEAEAIWDRIVASAAPAMPILKTYINRGSRTVLRPAPKNMVSIAILGLPSARMKWLRPILTTWKTEPKKMTLMYSSA